MLQKIQKPLEEEAQKYISAEKEVHTVEEAIAGAKDILAETVSDEADYRSFIRNLTVKEGKMTSSAKDDSVQSVYEMYYSFEEPVSRLAGHRILALNRGEKEKILNVKIEAPEEKILRYLEKKIIVSENPYTSEYLKEVAEDSYKRLIAPAIEREIRSSLTEKAEDSAIIVFGKNLEQLLMQPPIVGQVVLGWDPAFRTGCKLAVVDPTGKVLDTAVVYPTAPTNEKKIRAAKDKVKEFIDKYHITLISVGNGTASRESEQVIVEMLKEISTPVQYVITNEAGASVYSASKLAKEEFPDYQVEERSAVSIARRLQDPLAELVKIEPKAISVGQYQHDIAQKQLEEQLDFVVEKAVNSVGVDINTASVSLLQYVSGLNSAVAKNIIKYRDEHGKFTNREEIKNVNKLGSKTYQQSIGFLRIPGANDPFDATAIHPENYQQAKALLKLINASEKELGTKEIASKLTTINKENILEELKIDSYTLDDIIDSFIKPNRSPRDNYATPLLKKDILKIEDLKPGMVLEGTVRNVVDFGAFIDIGLKNDGLVHISKISHERIKHPLDKLSIGDIVEVYVIDVDVNKHRVGLSMIKD